MSGRRRLLATMVVIALFAAGCAGVFGDAATQTLEAEFASTFNLFEGSAVRVAGVDVGHVERVDVPPGSDSVHVTMRLEPAVRLPADVRAVIVPQALIGERYVQLEPPYRQGQPTWDLRRTIPVARTAVPDDFDEVLASLNDYLRQLPEEEVARLVTNLAGVLAGQGDDLGRTLEHAEEAIDVLRANDDELILLASHLSDVNEALNSRSRELGAFIEDANTVVSSLAEDRERIDAALGGLARVTHELADLLVEHRPELEEDLAAVTRVGRTAVRNLSEIDRFVFWSAELYRGAERVFDRDENWLPLVDNVPGLSTLIADRVRDRIAGMCLRVQVDCSQLDDRLPDRICFEPVLACDRAADPDSTVPLGEVLDDTFRAVPELPRRLQEHGIDPPEVVDGLVPGDEPDDTGVPLPDAGAPTPEPSGPLADPRRTLP
ncbi:MAG TPA: MCE family protein [Nitriliruptorales bacterium]|nr:MCE family protein [Nitriliruptorales bacterium]